MIDNRFQIYSNELNDVLQDPLVLPSKTAYNFFSYPLETNNSDCNNILKITELKIKILQFLKSDVIGKSVDKIILDLNLKSF